MRQVTSYPGQVYDYVYGNFGLTGLIVAGVAIVVGVVGVFIGLDRRNTGEWLGVGVALPLTTHHSPLTTRSRTTGVTRVPIPSIVPRITSPGFRNVPVVAADAGRRAGRDQVARLQRDHLRNELDHGRRPGRPSGPCCPSASPRR